jgi:hypothetical protein
MLNNSKAEQLAAIVIGATFILVSILGSLSGFHEQKTRLSIIAMYSIFSIEGLCFIILSLRRPGD